MAAPIPTAGTPPYLGGAPTSINQIIWAPARIPTTFTASVQSGDRSQGQVVGTATMALPLIIDYTMGDFSLTIQFPPNSFLYLVSVDGLIPFTFNAPTIRLGRTVGGAEIMAVNNLISEVYVATIPVGSTRRNQNVLGSLPFPGDVGVLPPWQASLTVAGNAGTSTAGMGLVSILYGRQ
jgi:hypothetical protein